MPESQKTKSENLVAKSPTTDFQPIYAETQKSRKINRKNKIGREDLFYELFQPISVRFFGCEFYGYFEKK